MRIYRYGATPPGGTGPPPLVACFHGGGWTASNIGAVDRPCRSFANASGWGGRLGRVPVRLGEPSSLAAAEYCSAATLWSAEHAAELGVDPERAVVAGGSAGSNLSPAALVARDGGAPKRGAPIAT